MTDRWFPLRPHEQQQALLDSRARFLIACCGRSGGKSEIAKRWIMREFLTPRRLNGSPAKFFVAAGSWSEVKRIYWDDLVALMPEKYEQPRTRKEGHLETKWGATLDLVTVDSVESAAHGVQGSQYVAGVLDEYADAPPDALAMIFPALSFYSARLFILGVPKRNGRNAKAYQRLFEAARDGKEEDTEAFSWTSKEILPPEEIAMARTKLSAPDYLEQYEAQWLTNEGLRYDAFSQAENVRECHRSQGEMMFVFCDFNITPHSWCVAHRRGELLEVFEEISLENANTQKMLDTLWGRHSDHSGGFTFIGDATSRARKTAASESDYIQIYNDERFKTAGRNIFFATHNPPVLDRVAAVNARLCNSIGQRRLFISPACPKLIDDMLYISREILPSADLGHMSDALGYGVNQIFPLKINLTESSAPIIIINRR